MASSLFVDGPPTFLEAQETCKCFRSVGMIIWKSVLRSTAFQNVQGQVNTYQ
ncbi:hypothetical protein Mp_3g22430 [Marchantia polymorpha subsp. ruderalis]|uniref:Uncharacterized protein n=2 Tax=Marchantia polymorpha TaxID=3197 RepID=A0AAF6B3L7_MARPO|nr:hypothetical protein MARPO_0024s0021 [Marchantia polymorpha]PTQ43500.1 hypothetical protein MARPO_0024s0021 [Marchantia polymorpha]BBN06600.1 hypothetical protein Mp_3g22430 [Marchantia polymorpha subsp. ruderalis]BBN06601.1 hypothetical protein Mp_3g22430 [Marchantia polymorpha subsp. ruderalis]|eukprot:PTQ43499.1 hypothetical protein MARPO_0024s0021 [Marchantia polymorpha]